jgi:hypothetical protein
MILAVPLCLRVSVSNSSVVYYSSRHSAFGLISSLTSKTSGLRAPGTSISDGRLVDAHAPCESKPHTHTH